MEKTRARGMGKIFTKTTADPVEAGDGIRILVMRRFPRGRGSKESQKIDLWFRELGPSPELIDYWFEGEQGEAAWKKYSKSYVREMRSQKALIRNIRDLSRRWNVTLLCWDHDKEGRGFCHRHLLKKLIEDSR
jgi:uncharacterized protein YeaO (DUF488 family)